MEAKWYFQHHYNTDTPETSSGASRNPAMSVESQHSSVVARDRSPIKSVILSQETTQWSEPLISTPLPDFPWQKATTGLFELEGRTYFMVVDYFSRYPEVIQLKSTTSLAVIQSLKGVFSRHEVYTRDAG